MVVVFVVVYVTNGHDRLSSTIQRDDGMDIGRFGRRGKTKSALRVKGT